MARRPVKTEGIRSAFEGEITRLTPQGLEGWVWNPSDPQAAVAVQVATQGAHLGTFLADRTDGVPGAPPGHGFRIQFADKPPALNLPATLDVTVANSDHALGSFQAVTHDQLGHLLANYRTGHIDAIQNGHLLGWAADFKRPGQKLRVELLDNGRVVAQAECNVFRPDVRASGIGDGNSGFSIPLPASALDGKLHAFSVRFEGGGDVEGGPLLFGPSSFGGVLQQLAQLQTLVLGMQTQLQAVAAPNGETYRQLERSLFARHEALMDIFREGVEGEMAALRKLLTQDNRKK